MLAEKIMKAFEVCEWCDNSIAMERHFIDGNQQKLMEVYDIIFMNRH